MEFLLASLIVMAGAMVQTALGFGMAVIAAPLLVLVDPRLVPGPLVFCALILALEMTRKNRQNLDMRGLVSAFAGRVPGTMLGVWLLSFLSAEALSVSVGGIVLIAVLLSVASFTIKPTRVTLFIAGVLSGVFGGSTGIGGPPMALLLQHDDADRIRANLSGFFIFGSVVSLVSLTVAGHFGLEELKYSLLMTPAVVIGYRICRRLPLHEWECYMRPAILAICSVSGVLAMARGWF